MASFTPEQDKINEAVFAYFSTRLSELRPKKRLAYYTTAETAVRVIQSKTFWLRNPRLMNDYAEVVQGQESLWKALHHPDVIAAGTDAIDGKFPGAYADLITSWADIVAADRTRSFVACLTEIDADDDEGRLSMWRAYGGTNGVALVVSDSLLDLDSNFVRTFHSPVLYGGAEDVTKVLVQLFGNLAGIPDAVGAAGLEFVKERVLNALHFLMLSIKHTGFAEEEEWRMIHPLSEETAHIQYRSENVRGHAEVVCEVNLASHPALAPGAMFEKVIVGPCAFATATEEAIALAFHKAGAGIPPIVSSSIPLRHL